MERVASQRRLLADLEPGSGRDFFSAGWTA